MTDRVDRHAVHVQGCKADILFSPTVAVVGGSKHAATDAHDRTCPREDVTVAGVDRQCGNVG